MRAILTYHSIDSSGSPVSVDPRTFRRHVRWLASGTVRVTTVEELLALPAETQGVAVTFDDGYRNFASVAWPLLREEGLPATLFVVTDFVGSENGWDRRDPRVPSSPLLGWEELGRLAEEGVTLGSHSRRHPRLTELDAAGALDEIRGSARRILVETGVRTDIFAYPYGNVGGAVRDAVGRVYRFACTAELRPVGPGDGPLMLPRLDAYYLRRPGLLESWGTRRLERRLRLRAAGRRLRRVLARH